MVAEQIDVILADLGMPGSAKISDVSDQLLMATDAVSPLESLCARYIENRDNTSRTPSAINRIAFEMDRCERVRKICRVGAIRSHCDLTDQDEIRQRTLEVFFHSMLGKLREANAVYAVVYVTAYNVGREIRRDKQRHIFNHDSIEDMSDRGEEIGQASLAENNEVDHDLEIDTATATRRMAIAFQKVLNGERKVGETGVFHLDQDPMVTLVKQTPESAAAALPVKKPTATKSAPAGGKSGNHLSPDQQELVDIGNELDLRNQDYAFSLGIGLPRLSSYIYGRTASVPQEVMEKARALKAEDPHLTERLNRFKRPMSTLLKEWEDRLQIKDNDDDLANCLGVTKMTIYRWRKNETHPDATALARYEQFVKRFETQMASVVRKK